MSDKLQIRRQGEVEYWTLSDPGTRNALSEELVNALAATCTRATGDPSLRFVVLQGAGGSFCAGGSLGGFATSIGQAAPLNERDPLIAMNAAFGHLLHALCALPQILLAAVEGPAMGGGLGLVCCADFVLAAPSAVFAAPEVTLGIVPAQIAALVHRRLGDRAARQMLLSGEKKSADQAVALGLVDEVSSDLIVAVAERIQRWRSAAPAAVRHTKQLFFKINQAAALDFIDDAAIKFAASLRGTEAAEGLAAFAQKRKPGWAA